MKWDLVERVAKRMAGRYPLAGTYHETRLARQAPEMVRRASEMVEAETGLIAPGQPAVEVVSRDQWVRNNLASFSLLLEPIEQRLDEASSVAPGLAQQVMSVELGAVLGLLSRRVLGQYELVLPTGDQEQGDTVFLVGANILQLERQNEFRPDEFRFWVALHECTHRLQFQGVPWMREYFLGLVNELVAASQPEPGRVGRVSQQIRDAAASGEPMVDETGLFGLFATPDQRSVIDRVQALMSLLEGHGHVVMDRIGERELVTQARMSQIIKQRRQDPRTAMLMRLVGLEMKMKQYENGAKFIEEVERHAGWSALDRAWQSPEQLPTLDEINNALLWLERVG